MPHYKSPDNRLYWLDSDEYERLLPQEAVKISDEEAAEIQAEYEASQPKPSASEMRAAAYREEADPLFFKAQAGEIEQSVWLDKRAEIKERFPK